MRKMTIVVTSWLSTELRQMLCDLRYPRHRLSPHDHILFVVLPDDWHDDWWFLSYCCCLYCFVVGPIQYQPTCWYRNHCQCRRPHRDVLLVRTRHDCRYVDWRCCCLQNYETL